MAKFIQVTSENKKTLVNFDHVLRMRPNDRRGTTLKMTDGALVEAQETISALVSLLNQATTVFDEAKSGQ